MAGLAPLVIHLVRELSHARRERDLAVTLFCGAMAHVANVEGNQYRERQLNAALDAAMLQIAEDYERRRERRA